LVTDITEGVGDLTPLFLGAGDKNIINSDKYLVSDVLNT
jgi:hypothetical protein